MSDDIDEIDIRFDERDTGSDEYPVSFSCVRTGPRSSTFRAPFSPDEIRAIGGLQRTAEIEYTEYVRRRVRDVPMGGKGEDRLKDQGKRLFEALLPSRQARKWFQDCRQGRRILRLRLRLPMDLASIPWELLCDPDSNEWLLEQRVALVRSTLEPLRSSLDLGDEPLKVLAIVANPKGTADLNTKGELQQLKKALAPLMATGLATLRVIDKNNTLDELDRLTDRGQRWNVLHFIGHGEFDDRVNEGYLIVNDSKGEQQHVSSTEFARHISDQTELRLVVLNACKSAVGSEFSSVAGALVFRAKVPAVAAMQFVVSDQAALAFTLRFYRVLAHGSSLDIAMHRARANIVSRLSLPSTQFAIRDLGPHQQLSAPEEYLEPVRSVEWCTPVLFMNSTNGVVFSKLIKRTTPEKLLNEARGAFEGQRFEQAIELCGLLLDMDTGQVAEDTEELRKEAEKLQEKAEKLIEVQEQRVQLKALCDLEKWHEVLQVLRRLRELDEWTPDLDELERTARGGIKAETLWRSAQKHLAKGLVDEAEKALQMLATEKCSHRADATGVLIRMEAHKKLAGLRQDLDEARSSEPPDWDALDKAACAILGLLKEQKELEDDMGGREAVVDTASRARDEAAVEREWLKVAREIRSTLDKLQVKRGGEQLSGLESAEPSPPAYLVSELKERLQQATDVLAGANDWLDLLRKSPCIWDPALDWPDAYPYAKLKELGAHPAISIAEAKDVQGISGEATGQGLGEYCRELAQPAQRAWLDLFTYEVENPAALVQGCQGGANGDYDWPDRSVLEQTLGADAAVAHLIVGRRDWALELIRSLLKQSPTNGRLAHHLALLSLWGAEGAAADQEGSVVEAHWREAIAAWAITLESLSFWDDWSQRRADCYGQDPGDGLRQTLRQRLIKALDERLLRHADDPEQDPLAAERYRDLKRAWDLEHRAARWLAMTGGIETDAGTQELVAGPIGIETLGREDALAEHALRLQQEDELDAISADPERTRAKAWLRYGFSQLGHAAVSTEHAWPDRAIEALAAAACPVCAKRSDADCYGLGVGPGAARVCCPSCPDFDQLNPAYRRLPDKHRVLWRDGQELMRQNRLKVAELAVAQPEPDMARARDAWEKAMRAAADVNRVDQTRAEIGAFVLARAEGVAQKLDPQAADSTQRLGWIIDLLEAGLERAPEQAQHQLKQMLAETLTARGVETALTRADTTSNMAALPDLVRALSLNPKGMRTRNEYCMAITNAVDGWDLHVRLDQLRKAFEVAASTLEDHPDNPRCIEILANIAGLETRHSGRPDAGRWKPVLPLVEEARRQAEAMLGRHPDHEPSQGILASVVKIELHLGEGSDADPFSDQPLSRTDELVTAARDLERAGNLEQALVQWEQAVAARADDETLKHDMESVVLRLADKLLLADRRIEARDLVEKWANAWPQRQRLQGKLEEVILEIELYGD